MSTELVKNQDESTWDELDMQLTITTAKTYPRNIGDFIKLTTELATQDIETAESCFYCMRPFGGKSEQIEGGSIRLAEIAAYAWGNMHTAKRVIRNDGKFVTGQGIAWDLERNQGTKVEVQRSIIDSYGKLYSYDLQAKTANAAASIAYRNAVFTMIPQLFINPIWKKAKEYTLSDKKLRVRLDKTIEHFNKYGVETKRILNFFQKKSVKELDLNDIAEIFSTANAIKEKLISVNQAFLIEDAKGMMLPDDTESMKNLFK